MVSGIILLGLAAFMWFGVVKSPAKESIKGSVVIIKKIFGEKGYLNIAKFLTAFLALGAIAEFYKYFTA